LQAGTLESSTCSPEGERYIDENRVLTQPLKPALPKNQPGNFAAGFGKAIERMERLTANSRNLDLLRSFAVLLVVGFHLAKFFNWQFGALSVKDFGLLGVMLFFVHTTLVLMFSLERLNAKSSKSLFVPFIIRRCFRIYPLAIFVVAFAYMLHIPSDLQFGKFNLLHQSTGNLLANLFLIQNVTQQKANPGILWSLPLELQMYLALPALFLFAAWVRSWWGMIAFWCSVVALWFAVGSFSGMLPLSEGGIRSPVEALLKFTRFVPCFLPGIVAYKLWGRSRFLPASSWLIFLGMCCAAFLWLSGKQPIETGWFICLAIGLGASFFREMRENILTRLTKRIARYSYGIYLLHYFAIWIGFVVCRGVGRGAQFAIFGAVLISLSALLYHLVEAPLIEVGANISEKFTRREYTFRVKSHSVEGAV
jgi:peptidoglycan/LPS O-acetylase OafA/YrhL